MQHATVKGMRDFAQRALVTLEVYLERGRQALISLKSSDFERANSMLRLRTAAFHNFRSIDAQATSNGFDTASDPDFRSVWQEIDRLDRDLNLALQEAKDQASRELIAVRKVKSSIAKYRSSTASTESFAKTV